MQCLKCVPTSCFLRTYGASTRVGLLIRGPQVRILPGALLKSGCFAGKTGEDRNAWPLGT
jgi:hypothetical protein